MTFNSTLFIFIFLPIILILYYTTQRNHSATRNRLLLMASLGFYAWCEPVFVVFMFFAIIANYFFGLLLGACQKKGRGTRIALALAVLFNLTLLISCKYADFAIESLNQLTGGNRPLSGVALPVGISFFTLHALSYLVDLYRKNIPAQKRFSSMALYLSFFPLIIAGPIVRYADIEPQIESRERSVSMLILGLRQFVTGLAKVSLIAGVLAPLADTAFDYSNPSAALAWAGIIGYTLQVYFSFSGFADMAIGLGKMFGFTFSKNFDYPYTATSVRDFWRRWNISLTSWMREYLYFPLGGSRKGSKRTVFNLLIVFLATGLWHGAGWTFVVWGLVHGIFMLVERQYLGERLKRLPKPVAHIYTIVVVMLAWVVFRADTLGAAMNYLRAMFTFSNLGVREMLANLDTGIIVAVILGIVSSTKLVPRLLQKLFAKVSSINEKPNDRKQKARITMGALFTLTAFALSVILCVTGQANKGETEAERPGFTVDRWLSGDYQQGLETKMAESLRESPPVAFAYNTLQTAESKCNQMMLYPLATLAKSSGNHSENQVINHLIQQRNSYSKPRYPEYLMNVPKTERRSDFRGSDDIVVGENGVLFHASDIDELFGFNDYETPVDNKYFEDKLYKLAMIQDELESQGSQFLFLITPNKAAYYPEYIPQWYLDKYEMPKGYERPYDRLLGLLADSSVNYLDSRAVFAEHGITNVFPMTGSTWQDVASTVVTQGVLESYSKQAGTEVRQLETLEIQSIKSNYYHNDGYSNPRDMFEALYSNWSGESANAIADTYYYSPIIKLVNEAADRINGVWLQSDSFCGVMEKYLSNFAIADNVILSNEVPQRDELLSSPSLVVLEYNEATLPGAKNDPIDSLYNYLTAGTGADEGFTVANEIISGENGVLFEEETIHELYGLSSKYRAVTNVYLNENVRMLSEIERMLREQGIGFTVLITPSKASQYKDDIPAKYLEQFDLPTDYVRPYNRLLDVLKDQGVSYIDSASVLHDESITHTFPETGSRWNPVASLTLSKALLSEYTAQTGLATRNWRVHGIQVTDEPVPYDYFGVVPSSEQNLLEALGEDANYAASAIEYYTPEVELINSTSPRFENLTIYGSEFTNEITYWLGSEICGVRQYVENQNTVDDWGMLMPITKFVVIEINETNVFDMFGELDGSGAIRDEVNFVQSLYDYLMN